MTNLTVAFDTLGLTPEAAASLPEGIRRQLGRFMLRWGRGDLALPLLPERDRLAGARPRDGFDCCRALLAAGEVAAARDLARHLVNAPDAGNWGHRAVGEVFLALGKPDRADERFRAAGDPVGRARAALLLGNPRAALDHLRNAAPDDPETERVRLEALRAAGDETEEAQRHLEQLLAEECQELLEALGGAEPAGAVPADDEGLRAALRRVFGYDEFRPGQLDVIRPLINGQSVLGLMPTGAGKSICFQLPAALLPGATVVISPLIALMKDQVDGLPPALYRRATLINSSLDPGEADRRLDAVARGEVSLIYAAPERLRQRGFVRALQRRGVSLFVIDEAHCVSLWGHDFRPDYFFIREVLQDLGRPTVLALTATATPEMQEDIGRQLGITLHRVNLGTFRPNLALQVRKCGSEGEKWSALLELLREARGAAIVYVDRRKLAEDIAFKLQQEGIPAEAYHAGMDRTARDAAQSRFMLGEVRVIAATVAFGMGVDKADVRLVAHYNLPRSLEAYYQEAGRAGRDGLPARCALLYTSYDKGNLTRRAGQDRMQPGEIASLHRAIARRARAAPGGGAALVPVEELEREVGTDSTRIRVGISLLQGIGALERGYDLPGSVWLARTNGGGDERLTRFMAAVGLERGGRPVTLPAHRAAGQGGFSLDALEPALLDWQEAGWIRYRSGGRGLGVRVAGERRELEKEIRESLRRMEEMDRFRLQHLAAYLECSECRQSFVSRYFGRPLESGCGSCDNCRGGGSSALTVADRGTRLRATAVVRLPETDEESALFERLRAWRREKAREEGVPAYVIFHDRVLYEIAHRRPERLSALAEIPGIGQRKLQTYGPEVVGLVRETE